MNKPSKNEINCPACDGEKETTHWIDGELSTDICGRCNGKGKIIKPSKKTEWEKEFDERFVAVKQYYGKDRPALLRDEFANEINLPNKVKEFIRSLLHQRDNEIIEKIRGMKLNLPKDSSMPLASKEIEKHEWSYNQALDDILTYLSSK